MKVKSDIEIAREAKKLPIKEVARKLGIEEGELIPFGHDKAKISDQFIKSVKNNENGKLILVTAVNPYHCLILPGSSCKVHFLSSP